MASDQRGKEFARDPRGASWIFPSTTVTVLVLAPSGLARWGRGHAEMLHVARGTAILFWNGEYRAIGPGDSILAGPGELEVEASAEAAVVVMWSDPTDEEIAEAYAVEVIAAPRAHQSPSDQAFLAALEAAHAAFVEKYPDATISEFRDWACDFTGGVPPVSESCETPRLHALNSAYSALVAANPDAGDVEFRELVHGWDGPQTEVQAGPLRICVVALVTDAAGRILLVRDRKRCEAAGHPVWELPGGGVEAGESWRDAAAREVREEAGIEIAVRGLADAISGSPRPGAAYPSVVLVARAGGDGEPSPATGDDVLEARWFAREDLPELAPLDSAGAVRAWAAAREAAAQRVQAAWQRILYPDQVSASENLVPATRREIAQDIAGCCIVIADGEDDPRREDLLQALIVLRDA